MFIHHINSPALPSIGNMNFITGIAIPYYLAFIYEAIFKIKL
jgi:hypothetical protein